MGLYYCTARVRRNILSLLLNEFIRMTSTQFSQSTPACPSTDDLSAAHCDTSEWCSPLPKLPSLASTWCWCESFTLWLFCNYPQDIY